MLIYKFHPEALSKKGKEVNVRANLMMIGLTPIKVPIPIIFASLVTTLEFEKDGIISQQCN